MCAYQVNTIRRTFFSIDLDSSRLDVCLCACYWEGGGGKLHVLGEGNDYPSWTKKDAVLCSTAQRLLPSYPADVSAKFEFARALAFLEKLIPRFTQ